MKRITTSIKVGEILPLNRLGITKEEIKGVYTVYNHELGMKLLDGSVVVEDIELVAENGVAKEEMPNVILDNKNQLQYYSLIPRKRDNVVVVIECKEVAGVSA